MARQMTSARDWLLLASRPTPRALRSFTSELNLSHFGHTSLCPPV